MSNHNCVINGSGLMKCWGQNNYGQLGLGDTNNRGDNINEMGSNLPFVQIGNGLKVDKVSTGYDFTCILLTSNQIKCWGGNFYGQLGLGISTTKVGDTSSTTPDQLTVVNLGTTSYPITVVCGFMHTCVLFANKKVKCYGSNAYGQIGWEGASDKGKSSTNMGDNLPFVNLGTGIEAQSIYTSGSSSHTCTILATTQLMKCWGSNTYGQLGYGDSTDRGRTTNTMGDKLPAIDLGTIQTIKQIALLDMSTCALRTDDILFCFGLNDNGQLGIGSTTNVITMGTSLVETTYDTGKTIKQISAGDKHVCVLYDDNVTLKCIGFNIYGQLGQGDAINRGTSPSNTISNISAIGLGTDNLQISYVKAMNSATCVVFVDVTVKCYGNGGVGQLGNEKIYFIGDGSGEMGSNLPFLDLFQPTSAPTKTPTNPTATPTKVPTKSPTYSPTFVPTTQIPSRNPITNNPSHVPSQNPTTNMPTKVPTKTPTNKPTVVNLTSKPTNSPVSPCNYATKKKCKKNFLCSWKKGICKIK